VADGSLACNAFAARARQLGAQIRQGVEVIAIRQMNGRIAGVDTSIGVWDAPVVVNTAGPWGPKLAAQAGVLVPAEPSRHQIASFYQPADFNTPMHMIVADLINAHYVRSETGGLTLAGSIENDTSDKVPDPDQYNQWTDSSFVETMMERSLRRMPALAKGGLARGWAGLYTVTPDWNPIIDRLEAVPGLILGLGFSGSGFKLGPVVGEILADLATGEQQCPIAPDIFSLNRFAEGIDLSSEYGYNILG
jgi:sarcosine oxidase subunit beta